MVQTSLSDYFGLPWTSNRSMHLKVRFQLLVLQKEHTTVQVLVK